MDIQDTCGARIALSARLVRQLGALGSTLRAVVERDDDAVIIYAGGEVDASSEPVWRRLLAEAAVAAAPDASLIVDLTGLTFVSCGALEALRQQSRWCRRRGLKMTVAAEQKVIRQVLGAFPDSDWPPLFSSVAAARGRDADTPADVGAPEPSARTDGPASPVLGHPGVEPDSPAPHRVSLLSLRRFSSLGGLLTRRRPHPAHVGYTTDHTAYSWAAAPTPPPGSNGSPLAVSPSRVTGTVQAVQCT